MFRSLCEFVGDCFGPRYFSSGAALPQLRSRSFGSCAPSEKYLGPKQSPPISHNDLKKDGAQLLLSKSIFFKRIICEMDKISPLFTVTYFYASKVKLICVVVKIKSCRTQCINPLRHIQLSPSWIGNQPNNIILLHESENISKESLFPEFQLCFIAPYRLLCWFFSLKIALISWAYWHNFSLISVGKCAL